jgi:hypothetical protein
VTVRADRADALVAGWIASWFDPGATDDTVAALSAADAATDTAAIDRAKATVADCDKRLARFRRALASTDDDDTAAEITTWIADTIAERTRAQQALDSAPTVTATAGEIRALLADLRRRYGDIAAAIGRAEPAERAALYSELNLSVTYDPLDRVLRAEARPHGVNVVSEGGCRASQPEPCSQAEAVDSPEGARDLALLRPAFRRESRATLARPWTGAELRLALVFCTGNLWQSYRRCRPSQIDPPITPSAARGSSAGNQSQSGSGSRSHTAQTSVSIEPRSSGGRGRRPIPADHRAPAFRTAIGLRGIRPPTPVTESYPGLTPR